MAEQSPRSLVQRLLSACLMLLGCVVALWLALELLAQIWGWLLLVGAVVALVAAVVIGYRVWRERRW